MNEERKSEEGKEKIKQKKIQKLLKKRKSEI